MMKRKICVVTGYRSDYTKIYPVLKKIKESETLELILVVIGAHLISGFGSTIEQIKKDGFEISAQLKMNVEGADPSTMAISIGLGIIQITPILNLFKPDVVLVCGDRYEIFSAVVASAVNNYPVAHIQGGEVSGTIDESFRHSITKLSHIHFPSTALSAERIIKMGEDSKFVFNVGCPSIDYIKQCPILSRKEILEKWRINDQPYILVMQHSVTTEYEQGFGQMIETLEGIHLSKNKCIVAFPNPDAGSDNVRFAMREYEKKYKGESIIIDYFKNIPFEDYLSLLFHADCLVGNSSSGIREAHIFGVPVINIGTRQNGRERTTNIIDVGYDRKEIYNAIKKYSGNKIDIDSNVYGDGTASIQIVEILEKIDLTNIIQKRICI